jgi:hypothetical protein
MMSNNSNSPHHLNNHFHQKREYYLKGGDDPVREDVIVKRVVGSRDSYGGDLETRNSMIDSNGSGNMHRPQNLSSPPPQNVISPSNTAQLMQPPKSSLKQTGKKPGVTFDEKLEVYEVKNPHYGLEIKSEKREIRKKKKDKQKEEEIVLKTKLDMKLKIQNQNMLHYYVHNFSIFLYYKIVCLFEREK